MEVTVGNTSGRLTFSSVPNLFDQLSNNGLQSVQASYTNTSAANVSIGYRGLPILINTEQNSAAIQLVIPSLQFSQTFNARSDRDGNLEDLTEFFKRDGGAIISALQKKLAEESPVDPIAGNPASLQSQMAANTFDSSFTSFATNIKSAPPASTSSQATSSAENRGLVAATLRFGRYSQAGFNVQAVTLPLSYTYRGLGDGRLISVNLPITYAKVGDANVGQAGLGISYRHPVNPQWSLTPAFNLGLSGSLDLGSVAALSSASVTSQYSFRYADLDWSIGNMIGYYNTLKIQTKDFSYDPKIRNTIFRNGVMVSQPVTINNQKYALEYSFINTQFSGSALYNRWTNEFGITIGTPKSSNLPTYLRAGLTVLSRP